MPAHNDNIGTAVIASSGTESTVLASKIGLGDHVNLMVYAPAALTGTVTVEVSYLEAPTTEWYPLYIDGANVTITAAKAQPIVVGAFRALRFVSGSAEGAARSFVVVAQLVT